MQAFIDKFGQWGWQALIALAIIVLLLVLFFAIRAQLGNRIRAAGGGRARQPRLGVVEAYELDRQRQLVLLRRDNVEHLVMIGGPNDILVESTIVRSGIASADSRGRIAPQFEDQPQPVSAPVAAPPAPVAAQIYASAAPPPVARDTRQEPMPPSAVSFPPVVAPSAPAPPVPASAAPAPLVPVSPSVEAPAPSRRPTPAWTPPPRPTPAVAPISRAPPLFGRGAVAMGGLPPKPAEPNPVEAKPAESQPADVPMMDVKPAETTLDVAPPIISTAPPVETPMVEAAESPELPAPVTASAPPRQRFDFSRLSPRAQPTKPAEPKEPEDRTLDLKALEEALQGPAVAPPFPPPVAPPSPPVSPRADAPAAEAPPPTPPKIEAPAIDIAPPPPPRPALPVIEEAKPEPVKAPPVVAEPDDALMELEAEMAKLLGRPGDGGKP